MRFLVVCQEQGADRGSRNRGQLWKLGHC
jgi:hypothetical protein